MDLTLTEDQRLLVTTARRFVETELMPLEEEVERAGRLPQETAKTLLARTKAAGFLAINIPADLGGGGLSVVDTCLVEEQFGRTSDILVRRSVGNVYEVLLLAAGAQRERWLMPTIRGERVFSVAFTEPEAGSDAAGIKTRAVRKGDGWVLSGQKIFISDGEFSDFFVVSAVTDPTKGARGISLFLVDKGTPGFSIGADQPMMGLRGTSHVPLYFDNVALGPEHLLGREGDGLKHAFETLGRIRLAHIGARAVGKAMRLMEVMTAYAAERRQFGRPIGDNQMIGQMLADSAMEIRASRLLVLETASALDHGQDAREQISMVKVHAAEMLGRVADRAVQVHGGSGYCRDLPIERIYRDARIFRIYDGTSEIHRSVIARSLLKQGAAPLTDLN